MLRSPLARHAAGVALGALAGASLCLSVLPMGLQVAGYGSHLAIGAYLARFTPFAAAIMAAGGWGVARSRHPLHAMAVFSMAGLAAGLLLAGYGLSREARLMAAGTGAGWLYGLLGGLVIGRILAPPAADDRDDGDEGAGEPMAAGGIPTGPAAAAPAPLPESADGAGGHGPDDADRQRDFP